ncbi:MAG: gluconeogenesis factor YvcK family protein [Cyanobacteria bacterium J06626_14]
MMLQRSFNKLSQSAVSRSPKKLNRWIMWMAPGLFVKRWMFISLAGTVLTALGVAIWANRTPVFYLGRLISSVLSWITSIVPSYVSGPAVLLIGIILLIWGQNRTLNSITEVLMQDGDDDLIDQLVNYRRLNRGPKVVVLGGGTGLSTLLRGLKAYSANITAIVTVADDGGSSGRLRREIGVLPPGDIRNCLAALADEEKLITELFQYRFQAGNGLVGHSFGNLFLTAMGEVTGDVEQAIAAISKVLAVRGQVVPATLSDVKLWAELADGRRIEGESQITEAKGQIIQIGCEPSHPPALPRAIQAIQEADFIILGPGSLYTSIIPNLLVPDIVEAIANHPVPRIYVCNIMTEMGETEGYTVSDHIKAIDNACGQPIFDAVLIHRKSPSAKALIRYAQEGCHPVLFDRESVLQLGRRTVIANILKEDSETGRVRHNSERLAGVLMRWFRRH